MSTTHAIRTLRDLALTVGGQGDEDDWMDSVSAYGAEDPAEHAAASS
jgi:hypothetical protein